MAIVEMKRLSLLAPASDEKEILELLQRLRCVHLSPASDEDIGFETRRSQNELSAVEDRITRVGWAIGKLNKYDTTKKPLLGDKPTITTDEASALLGDKLPALMGVVEALEALERESGEARGQSARVQAVREQLQPWASFTTPIPDIKDTRNTVSTLGTAQKAALEALIAGGELSPLCAVEIVSAVRDAAYIYVVVHREAEAETFARLKDVGFAPASLGDIKGTVAQRLEELQAETRALDERQVEITARIAEQASDINELKALYDSLTTLRDRLAARQNLVGSKSTFYLNGWVPDVLAEKLEKRVHEISPSACLEFTDPEENEEPPVMLNNGPVVSPYETVVTGFALPIYRGLDPTAVMMPFFVNFMGMMVSDAGYGLVMAIALPLLIMLLKPAPGTKRLMWILTGGGIMTVLWGALYNTWFGFAPFPSVFDPVNNSLPVMAVCVGLGAVHLFTGLGVAAYMNIKRGKIGAAIADQLSWFLFIVGLGLLIVMPDIGTWVALTGAGIILVTAGREKSKNPFKRLISGLGALYGTTSWVSDLLSYMRLFGMGLATGVIGMVINQLVGMVMSSGVVGIVIGSALFAGGHLFNLAINVLGAYVHSCRLQYIEFFGKFYEDGGKPFVPLASTNRYCYIKEARART